MEDAVTRNLRGTAVSFEKAMNGQDSHNEGAIWEHESFQQWGKLKLKQNSGPAFGPEC